MKYAAVGPVAGSQSRDAGGAALGAGALGSAPAMRPSTAASCPSVPLRRGAGRVAVAVLLVALLGVGAAHAGCITLPDAQARVLDTRVGQNATRALADAQARIAALEPTTPTATAQLAALYAVQARAYSVLELDREAHATAEKGLQLAPGATNPVRLSLLMTSWENVYDQPSLESAIVALKATRAAQAPGSEADTCLLISQGLLQMRQNRPDQAIAVLTQAYRAAAAPSRAEQQSLAAAALATVLGNVGDYVQALAFNQEVVDWDVVHGASLDLSVNRYLRGKILHSMQDYPGAIEEFRQARQLSVTLEDRQGVAFADQGLCRSHIELGDLAAARPECERARRVFAASRSIDVVKETQGLLARIRLAEGRPDEALAMLNDVLDHGGSDMPARESVKVYALRAQINAALHDYAHAYQDLNDYVRRNSIATDTERSRQVAVLRAQLESDRQIERNAALQRELVLSRERSHQQSDQLRWTRMMIAGGTLIILLLTYILLANLRHRRQLLRLASHDGLTGLPNRRRTAELASEALERARAAGAPLTVALLDFDHFKAINDSCGHAAGDHVLREFARLTPPALRAGDILGRWGGEEFLLVLPDCALDTGYAITERLRAIAVAIELPAGAGELRVRLSAGLATNANSGHTLDEIVASADVALYEAKRGGRDGVRIAAESFRAASTGVHRALRQGRVAP